MYWYMIRLLAFAAALLTVTSAAQAAEAAATPSTRELSGVACPLANSCWAVGDQTASGVTRTLIEHWNGTRWSVKASPSVAGSADTFLRAVRCAARLNCWAVGAATVGSSSQEPIAEHWNGRIWSLRILPEPAGLPADELRGVSCPGTTRCWAVGSAATKVGSPTRPLAEHWTGRKWSVVSTRSPGSFTNLNGVSCRSDINCWAVGAGVNGSLAEHWNGRTWSIVATPQGTLGGLNGVSCPGTVCLAAGLSGFPSALAERWNGTKWSLTPTAPLPPGTTSEFRGVSCVTSTSCFAVGGANNQTLIEHWLGSKWVRLKSPNPVGASSAELLAVYCRSATTCWAVGGPNATLAEHWNGSRWSIVRTP